MRKQIFTAALALLVSACAERVNTHGHVIKQQQIEQLKIGISDKQDVLQSLGTPSALATFADNRWYYISEKETIKTLDRKTLDSREIVIFDFDKKGLISSIQFKSKDDGRYVEPSKRATATQGEQLGIIEQMIDNLGKGGL